MVALLPLLLGILIASAPLCAAERYAFLVGVRHYDKAELTSLQFTENDVTDLATALVASGYDPKNVVLLTQTRGAKEPRFAPTCENIKKEILLVLDETKPGDSILVGFSGHGIQFVGEEHVYFCPSDAKLDNRNTLISLGAIYRAFEWRCKATSKMLLFDACRNDPQSALAKSRPVVNLETVGRPQQIALPGGIASLFSCSAGQQSFEHPEIKKGVFFHYIVEGLRGSADLDSDKEISFSELEQYTVRRVQQFVRIELGRAQVPERRGETRGLLTVASTIQPLSLLDNVLSIAKIDPKRDGRKGNWQVEHGKLIFKGNPKDGLIEVSHELPVEFSLELTCRPTALKDATCIALYFMFGTAEFIVQLAKDGSCIIVDGKDPRASRSARYDPVFAANESTKLSYTVKPDLLIVAVNEKPFLSISDSRLGKLRSTRFQIGVVGDWEFSSVALEDK